MRRNQHQQQSGGMRGGYDNRGGGGFNHRGDKDQPRRDRGDRGGGGREPRVYGIVISMKEVFGFLQPLIPVPGEEHLYFNDKDVFGERLHEGDEVQFVLRHGPRGPVAAQVRRLESGVKVKKSKVQGIVEKEADQYKFSPGLITVNCFPRFSPDGAEIELPEGITGPPQSVPFMPVDLSKGSRRIMKGDEVEFDLYVIPETVRQEQADGPWSGYCRGHAIRLVRTRSDRLIAEQIKELESSGAAREQGVIDTIKNDFGFVRPADRQEQIFFRLEDVLDAKQHLPNEGDEVDFYVINETIKGRVSDRAVHLKYLSHGTVQFEETLGSNVRAVVVVEPQLHPREEPGMLQLYQPLVREGHPTIETVELWSRCLPEGLGCMKCGDELEIDVTKYRPEKLIFARNVKVCSYRALGRAYGSMCDIKVTGGYGFIRSVQGDPDCYFRSSEVLGEDGTLISEKKLRTGQRVSYEIVMESVRGGGSKLRAVRVQTCPDANFHPRKAVLHKDVHGTIVREARKGDHHAVGSIELSEVLVDPQIPCYDVFASHQDLYCALQDFHYNKHWKEVTLSHMQPYQRYALHTLLRHHFTGIAHATVDRNNGDGKPKNSSDSEVQVLSLTEDNLNSVTNSVATASAAANSLAGPIENVSPTKGKGRKSPPDEDAAIPQEVRIWKIEDPAEFAEWAKASEAQLPGSSRLNLEGATSNVVSFQKSDLIDNLSGVGGGARAGSDVSFDVCVDRVTGARVAANVKVSDVQAEGGEWPQLGCLEYIRADGDMHGGYIRCVPSDEKLMWNQLVRSTEDDTATEKGGRQEWKLGSVVSFEIRVRGGVRYAAGVAVVPPESELVPQEEMELEGEVRGVVVESPQLKGGSTDVGLSVYVMDTTNCPSMKNKIVDLASAVQAVKNKALVQGGSTFSASDMASWEKKQLKETNGEADTEKKESDDAAKKSAKVEKVNIELSAPQLNIYPPLPVAVLPIRDDAVCEGLAVGNIVQCQLVANWFRQRLPLCVSKLTVLPSKTAPSTTENSTDVPPATTALANLVVSSEDTTPPGRVRGTVIRLKINSTLGFDVSEISLNDQYRKSGAGDDHLFYCDTRNLRSSENGSGRDKSSAAHVGDVVEFVPVPELCVAACPIVVKGMSRIGQGAAVPSATRRNVVNSQLQGGATSGVKSITMAEGPQGDSIGFAPGWRGTVDVKELPWGHLLGHLVVEEKEEPQAILDVVH